MKCSAALTLTLAAILITACDKPQAAAPAKPFKLSIAGWPESFEPQSGRDWPDLKAAEVAMNAAAPLEQLCEFTVGKGDVSVSGDGVSVKRTMTLESVASLTISGQKKRLLRETDATFDKADAQLIQTTTDGGLITGIGKLQRISLREGAPGDVIVEVLILDARIK